MPADSLCPHTCEERVVEQVKLARSSEIFTVLKTRIVHWQYPPGHRFTEDELCREFGVSRSPVREVLRMLEEHGLVDKVPYKGCTVKQPDFNEINELYDVRLILELAIVERLAMGAVADERLAALHQSWSALARIATYAEVEGIDLAKEDRLFHEALSEATGNATLHDLLCSINERLHFVRMTDITSLERLWDTCRQHIDIVEHIAANDAASAQKAMRSNIEGARQQVKTAIKEALAKAYLGTMNAK